MPLSNAPQSTDRRPSQWALIATNLVPLVGVLLFGWSAFEIVFLYWLENVVIGVMTVAKMVTCMPVREEVEPYLLGRLRGMAGFLEKSTAEQQAEIDKGRAELAKLSPAAMQGMKLFLVPFFCFHYGMFCMVHGMFVCVMFGGGMQMGGPPDLLGNVHGVLGNPWMLLSAVMLTGSHVVSFFTNYLWGGEYRRTMPPLLMFEPYPRIIVLHFAILLGGFAAMALGSPVWALLILIAGKILLDLKLHNWQHGKLAGQPAVLTTVPSG